MSQWPPQPPPAPVPAQPLHYVLAQRRGRPPVLTVVGVLSIVFGCLGALFSLVSGVQASGFYFLSVASTTAAKVQQTRTAIAAGAAVAPAGMAPAERAAMVQKLTALRPMTPRRRAQLEAILSQGGKGFGLEAVGESGTAPQGQSPEPPPDYFETPRGRLSVYNDSAVFLPNDGSPAVRASASGPASSDGDAGPDAAAPTPPATAPTTGPALTAAEVQSVIQQAQAAAGGKSLNAAQLAALRALLSAPGQTLVEPGPGQGAVTGVFPSGPNVTVLFSGGATVALGPAGNVVSVAAMPVMPTFSFNPVALGLMVACAVAALALAAYLLVCGIFVLRNSPRGRRLHLVYAWLKVPLSVVAAIAWAWVIQDFRRSLPGGAAPQVPFAVVFGSVPLVLGCLYPVALLVVMNLRSVREYYASVSGDAPAR